MTKQASPTSVKKTSAPATWQQRKSAQTRERVLKATIDCIFELGYSLTSTDKVVARAKVSRGAMLHHFPTRKDLVVAAVRYLNDIRMQNFLKAEEPIQHSSDRSLIGAGIDIYWKQLASPEFVVYQELQVLSRTDAELRNALDAAIDDIEMGWQATVQRVFPDLTHSSQHELSSLITRYLCEGMALYRAQRVGSKTNSHQLRPTKSETKVLSALKNFLRASYSDVRSEDSAIKNRQG